MLDKKKKSWRIFCKAQSFTSLTHQKVNLSILILKKKWVWKFDAIGVTKLPPISTCHLLSFANQACISPFFSLFFIIIFFIGSFFFFWNVDLFLLTCLCTFFLFFFQHALTWLCFIFFFLFFSFFTFPLNVLYLVLIFFF